MSELNEIALKTKARLNNLYFKISSKDNVNWTITQYVGPEKSNTTMMKNGWNRHPYLSDYITNDYPIFSLSDFISRNGLSIEKKSKEDLLKEEMQEYIELFTMNRNFALAVKELKAFANGITSNFLKYETFDIASDVIVNTINQMSCSQLDKANLLLKFNDLKNNLYKELDMLGLEGGRLMFSTKFKFFFLMIG